MRKTHRRERERRERKERDAQESVCVAGVNVPTLRTIFLRARDQFVSGGNVDTAQAAFKLDCDADVDGLVCWDGQGFENSSVAQVL